jgi:hypothetical protein
MDYFNDPNPAHDLFWITDKITYTHTARADHRCFLPEDNQRSPTAEARWKYFLTVGNPGGVLTAANHAAIKNAIYVGLSTMTLPSTWTYNRIEFDCVDGGGTQTVFSAPENDDNGISYWKVVLVTPPMPAVLANPLMPGTNINLDPQP